MMNPEWQKRLCFFIDPKLKAFDRELWRNIVHDLETRGVSWVEELTAMPLNSELPLSYLLMSDTSLAPNIRKEDKSFVFGAANMSLFGKKDFAGKNYRVDSWSEWKAISSSFGALFKAAVNDVESKLLEDSLAFFKSLVRRDRKYNFQRVKSRLGEVEEALLRTLTLEEARVQLTKMTEEKTGSAFYLLPAPQVYAKFKACLPFQTAGEGWYLCWKDKDEKSAEALYLYSVLEEILNRSSHKKESNIELEDMQKILSELPLPVALFNQNNELALHNALFIQLNLTAKACLSLNDDEQFHRHEELYRAKKVFLNDKARVLFYFIPIKEFLGKSSSPSSEELGIVSSSIAHELNNPLGGISGALDVILLDEHPLEVEQGLREMKAGVARCKKLVETFLGFSKLNAKNLDPDGDSHNIESSFNSAIELIRFRLIENNVSLDTKFEKIERYGLEYNPHVMSMIIYLVLGDLLTRYGHQKLVAGERSAIFSLCLKEKKKSLGLFISKDLGLGKDFLNSKLLNHLLAAQNLKISPKSDAIYLKAL